MATSGLLTKSSESAADFTLSFSDESTSEYNDYSVSPSWWPVLVILVKLKLVGLTICAILQTTTLILILSSRRIRKQHNIFPFNLVLADLMGVGSLLAVDIKWLVSTDEVRTARLSFLQSVV